MKGGFGGRFAPPLFGAAVGGIASTEIISAIELKTRRNRLGTSRPAPYAQAPYAKNRADRRATRAPAFCLLPLTERCGRAMRDALSALECLRAGPIEAVERSRPFRIALKL